MSDYNVVVNATIVIVWCAMGGGAGAWLGLPGLSAGCLPGVYKVEAIERERGKSLGFAGIRQFRRMGLSSLQKWSVTTS